MKSRASRTCPLRSSSNQTSSAFHLTGVATTPALFTADSSGVGQALIINEDGSANSTTNPAPRGSYVTAFLTGEGQIDPAGVTARITAPPSEAVPFTPI